MPKDRSPRQRPSRTTNQRKPPPKRNRRWLFLVACLGILLAASGTYAYLRSPWPRVETVRVVGADTLDIAAVIDLSGLRGRSMLRLPAGQARERILQIPQVRRVRLSRDWPQGVTIRIEERLPWGFWSVAGADYPVDEEGVVLAAGVPAREAPRIVEVASDRALGAGDRVDPTAIALAGRIFKESPRFFGQGVRELEYRQGVGIVAVFDGGMRVTFGDERAYDYKVAVLSKLLDDLRTKGVTPQVVDLRFGARLTYE